MFFMRSCLPYNPTEASGYVTKQENFTNAIKQLRAAAGYKCNGKNEGAPEWPVDVVRHSYGSYHLAKYGNRALLAELMGNSVQIIKKHYKVVVSKSAVEQYWSIAHKAWRGDNSPGRCRTCTGKIKAALAS